MRCLIFTEAFGLYGAERWTASVANGLARRGLEVVLARPAMTDDHRSLVEASVQLRDFNVFSLDDQFAWMTDRSLAAEIIDSEMPQVAIVSGGGVLANLGVREELLARGVPFVSVSHLGGQPGFDLPCPAPLRPRIAAVLNRAAASVGVSTDVVESLRSDFGMAADRGIVIPNGRPDEYFRPVNSERRRDVRRELRIDDADVMVLTIARVHPNKGYQYQLEAMETLRTRPAWSKLRFVWAGGTEAERRLRALVAARDLGDRVTLLGHREDTVDLLGAADVFVMPSRQEAAPLAIIEAMARGLAVITTPVNGVPELVGDCAVLVADPNIDPAATARELADAIELLAGDEARRRRLGETAHLRAAQMWREDRMLDQYHALVERYAK